MITNIHIIFNLQIPVKSRIVSSERDIPAGGVYSAGLRGIKPANRRASKQMAAEDIRLTVLTRFYHLSISLF
ncbi:MAG: hypothetical protein C0408_01125 [Odoribacter sp.]|nr:hypothetical protein [Odoribacter sp.]